MIVVKFAKTPDGIIKSYIDYNPVYNKIQVYIDGTIYAEFNPDELDLAIEYLHKAFLAENIIQPDIQLVTDHRPLEIQLREITGDPLTTSYYDYLCGPSLLKHIKTGLIIQVVRKELLISCIGGLLNVDNKDSGDERTPETIELNKKLQIVKINSDYRFGISESEAVRASFGYCFYVEGKGYVTYENNKTPYTPTGGIDALQSILKDGGFLTYEGMKFLHTVNEIGISEVCIDNPMKIETIEFILSHNNNLKGDSIKQAYLVKHKRKIKARISEYTSGKFRVEINSLSWDKENFEQCKQQVIENYSSLLEAINKPAKIKIINAPNVFSDTYFSIKHYDRENDEIWYFHIIRETEDNAKAQLYTYPPKENDIISISTYPIDISCLNTKGFTCLERGLFSDNVFEELMSEMD